MTGHRHATDRTDWMFFAECAEYGEEHLRIEAEATAAAPDVQNPEELFPIDECPGCDAEMAYIKQEKPTEVLD